MYEQQIDSLIENQQQLVEQMGDAKQKYQEKVIALE